MKKIHMVLALASLVIGSFSLVFLYYQFYFIRDVSIEELDADPEFMMEFAYDYVDASYRQTTCLAQNTY